MIENEQIAVVRRRSREGCGRDRRIPLRPRACWGCLFWPVTQSGGGGVGITTSPLSGSRGRPSLSRPSPRSSSPLSRPPFGSSGKFRGVFPTSVSCFASNAQPLYEVPLLLLRRKHTRAQFLPSPLAGEGHSVVQHPRRGEGFASQEALFAKRPPHPSSRVAAPSCPLPQGERAKIRHSKTTATSRKRPVSPPRRPYA